jgi:hypothetical protein
MEDHYEFLVVFKDLLLKFPVAKTVVDADYNTLLLQIEKEKELINAMHKSDLTKLIAETDHHIDRTFIGMNRMIDAGLHHFDPETVEAAQSLYNRFNAFGDITHQSYEKQIADVTILLSDLKNDRYVDKVILIGLAPWVAELTETEATFEDLIEQRNTESAHKPQERLKDVRRDSDALYHRMIVRINASAIIAEVPMYDEFINELNARIEYFNEHSYHHTRKDIGAPGHCVIEDVPEQTYSGRPVTPLTKVYYREESKPTVELVFAHDFFVTYKNNVEVGTATLVIHGKNAYRGQMKTTFNISRAK